MTTPPPSLRLPHIDLRPALPRSSADTGEAVKTKTTACFNSTSRGTRAQRPSSVTWENYLQFTRRLTGSQHARKGQRPTVKYCIGAVPGPAASTRRMAGNLFKDWFSSQTLPFFSFLLLFTPGELCCATACDQHNWTCT